MSFVKVTRKYQVTIPKEIREKRGIEIGDRLKVGLEGGKIVLERAEESVIDEVAGSWELDIGDSTEFVRELRKGGIDRLRRLGIVGEGSHRHGCYH